MVDGEREPRRRELNIERVLLTLGLFVLGLTGCFWLCTLIVDVVAKLIGAGK